jgi:hypothetical protein
VKLDSNLQVLLKAKNAVYKSTSFGPEKNAVYKVFFSLIYSLRIDCPFSPCKTTLPLLGIGEYGSNTPWLRCGVFEPYSPLPRLRWGGFSLKAFSQNQNISIVASWVSKRAC